MTSRPLLVLIVNYRTPDLTIDAARSLAPEILARGDTQLLIVDNGSDDGSAERMAAEIDRHGLGTWCALHAEEVNGGFAAGNNAGLRWYRERAGAYPEFVWLLNPDTLARPGALSALVEFLRGHDEAGIAGGRCLWPDGSDRFTAFRFPSPLSELLNGLKMRVVERLFAGAKVGIRPPERPQRVDWVGGASLMIRGSLIDRIGLMDENYFLYFEETEYCARAAEAGFECWTIPSSLIVHIGGQATGVTGQGRKRARRPRYWFASRARFFRQHHGAFGTHAANLLWLITYPVGRALYFVRSRSWDGPPRLWLDFLAANYGRDGVMYRGLDDISGGAR